jgi:NhaP-type Na+/H+ or K+/H+ antiporter
MLSFALALLAGVVAQSLARHLRMPGIVVLLLTGVALGPDGLGWIAPRDLGAGLFVIVDFAVAVILFEGGLNLQMSRLRREGAAIRRLITLGAGVTLVGGAMAANLWLGFGLLESLLFGALVIVTGPTVIGPLVSELRLKKRVSTLLEAEGVLIDPIGAIVAVVILEIALSGDPGALVLLEGGEGLARVAAGAVMGIVAGFALAQALRVSRLLPEGLQNVFALSSVLLLFAGAESLLSHSGVLAVTVAGVVVGNTRAPVERDLREFKDQLTLMLIGLLFILLAATVRFEQVRALGWGGLGVVATLVLVVRPLGVWLCTRGAGLELGERAFIAWVAPRGIVAAAVASLVAANLQRAGLEGGRELLALVFLTIAVTVTLAGLTAGLVGNLLGVRLRQRDTVAILSEEAGFSAVYGNALQESVMERARFGFVRTAVALTPNQTLNGVFVERARERFGVPRGLVATSEVAGLVSEQVGSGQASIVFEGPHDVERWDVRGRRGDVEVGYFVHDPEDTSTNASETSSLPIAVGLSERFVILAARRGGETSVMSGSWRFKQGDRIAVAIHRPEREDALRELASKGWRPEEDAAEAPSPAPMPEGGEPTDQVPVESAPA